MNFSTAQLIQIADPIATTVSSPKLDLIVQAWNHIAERYLQRIQSNRIFAARVRSVRLLAVHDAIQAVIDPGNGRIYREISEGSTLEAAIAATARASHDVLVSVFTSSADREDLADLLEESLSLIGNPGEKEEGLFSGAGSARAYIKAFAPLLLDHRSAKDSRPVRVKRELASASAAGAYW